MLGHLVLRRAAIEALCPTSATAETLAGDRLNDSRIDPIGKLVETEPRLTICLYTEEVEAEAGSNNNGLPHQPRVTLVLEMSSSVMVPLADGTVDIAVAASDALAEAALDLLVSQVYRRLVIDPPPAFRMARRRIVKFASVPFRDGEGGQKLAIRALSLAVDLPTFSTLEGELENARRVRDLLPEASEGRIVIGQAIAFLAGEPLPALPDGEPVGLDMLLRPGSSLFGTPGLPSSVDFNLPQGS